MIKSQIRAVFRKGRSLQAPRKSSGVVSLASRRFLSRLSSEPEEHITKLSDSKDPKRTQFFEYTWGSWIKNDKQERKKRETKFSIEGLTELVQNLSKEKSNSRNVDKSGEPFIRAPIELKDGSRVLTGNLSDSIFGKHDEMLVRSIASIHEGKHHRIYKVTISSGKEFVLRIPYALASKESLSRKINSEVATMDFLSLKLGLKVPKVVAFSGSHQNSIQSPFILMEYIEGDLLMKQWDPLVDDSAVDSKVKNIIKVFADFQEKVLSFTFNKYGSLYFYDDVSVGEQSTLPYDGEVNPVLKNRWRIGPSIEKLYAKNKSKLPEKVVNQFNGPWDRKSPLEIIKSLAGIELENAKHRLALAEADAGGTVEDAALLKKQIRTFDHLSLIGPKLIKPDSKSIMNVEEVFKPRLYLPDLDPLNVIVKNDNFYFLDFEYSTIKPFILSDYPSFIAYNGAKVFNIEEEIPEFKDMDEAEQQQYQFMYFKTRNERLWELELNSRRHDLIAIASPHIKLLKAPYSQALELRNDKDFLYVEHSIIQLQAMWESYVANELCNSTDPTFPIQYTAEELDEHQSDLEEYQLEILSTPFAATGGWVPQDMFDKLRDQGVIVETSDGNFKIETEKVL
ncbi:uncharacterized protein PRCAT00005562001 [Priceomyces carsonii]|uniref:uncharacterized protein n=1 Tax=Priceomyces carsonii TaxID=28549 RepID=UPI002ED93890|nr:unnamed protein product [Priceomyces carsonii]